MNTLLAVLSTLLFTVDCTFEACPLPEAVPRRISEQKCQDYKNEIAESYYFRGCLIKTYTCNSFIGLIVGGQRSRVGEFPHMAAIGWGFQRNVKFMCGGSLISEKFVMTVAHCATEHNGRKPSLVRLGDQNLRNWEDGARPVDYNIKYVIKHPDFDSRLKKNDIALIRLDSSVNFTNFIRPACLYQEPDFSGSVVATGWGQRRNNGPLSDELMKVSLNTIDRITCFDLLRIGMSAEEIFPSQICAGGEKGRDTCLGDSGGPIQVASDVPCVYNIVGMTSYGLFVCGGNSPSIYTRVWPYLDWIEEMVWAETKNDFVLI